MEDNREEEVYIRQCRICHDNSSEEELIKPCACSGTIGDIHLSCLSQWMQTHKEEMCRICSTPFDVRYIKVGHNLWKFLQCEHNRVQFIGTVLLNAGALLMTVGIFELFRSEEMSQLHYYWPIVTLIITINVCILALMVQSWFSFNHSFKYWQKRNYDLIILKNQNVPPSTW